MEAVYWYNVTPKDDVLPSTAPISGIYHYWIHVQGIDTTPLPELTYNLGEYVWIKPPQNQYKTL